MNEKNVFVIGAGASKEVNLPTGDELKDNIAKLLDINFDFRTQVSGDGLIPKVLRTLDPDINPYLKEAWYIRDALPQAISIDNFIDSQRGNEKLGLCGKLAIVRSILQAETKSLLHHSRNSSNRIETPFQFKNLEKSWFIPFFKLLTENCTVEDIANRFRSVVLIIFNYDRCLEHFLIHALQNYYRISEAEAAELIENLSIYHPYGSVGLLPWQKGDLKIGFGDNPNHQQLGELATKIKTFTEGTDPNSSEINEIHDHMFDASKLVFLGFAFHKLNMQLISPLRYDFRDYPSIFATTYGVSISDQRVITNQIKAMYSDVGMLRPPELNIEMLSEGCSSFFSNYWRSLSF